MKKLLFISLTLFVLFGCGKKENPLTPNYNNKASSANLPTIAQITPANYGQITDKNGDVTGIQSEIVVIFSDFMDASTINKTNITLYNISDGSYDTTLTIDYDAERKTAYITTDNFPDNEGFLFKITNGVHNLGGLPLDGNRNGKQDGAPYDNVIYAFYTGTGNGISNNIRTAPPTIVSISPGNSGNVSVHDTIYIQFGNGPMDTLKFVTQNFHLKDATGTSVTDSIESFGSNWVKIVLPGGDTLERGKMYTFTIDAYNILSEKDTVSKSGNTATEYLMRLDANGDGIISADEDSFYTWKFITQDFPGTDTAAPPRVAGGSGDYGTYYLFGFTKVMDVSTFTKENIKVWDNDGYVPGTFRVEMDSTGVKYYYDRKISGAPSGWVSMEVKDKYGNKLDGNGNGIGGEAGEDDWPSTSTGGDPYEPNNTYTNAYHIFNGDTLTKAVISPTGDHDWFFFNGQSGDSVIIDIDAQSIGSYMDSYLRLYDKNGTTLLTSNDDYSGSLDSHIEYTLTSAGVFYIMVQQLGDGIGGYNYFYHISLIIQ